jgi:alkylation response protein AidB-like acyl-CoA dehydrogenase
MGMPDLDLGSGVQAFRAEVREWLAIHWNDAARAREAARPFHERTVDREFSRRLGERGWIAVSWPVEHGGPGRSQLDQYAFVEEMAYAGAPTGAHGCAAEIVGPALIAFGTPAQRSEFLPAFLRGERMFCLGYSEAGAGSDLAALRLSAVRDGDEWVLNGEKLWTSRAEFADYHWLAVRTDPAAKPPHAGISVFMVPLGSPGISIRPSMALYGHTFAAVTYDNVRVLDSLRVGRVNEGWKVITAALASERVLMGSYVAMLRALLDALAREIRARPLASDPLVRDRLGALAAEIEAARHLALNGVLTTARGRVPVHEGAMTKVYSGELMERVTQAAIDMLGAEATLSEEAPGSIAGGRIEQLLRRSIMMVVGGGTAEIQRNVIAQRGLGLPR